MKKSELRQLIREEIKKLNEEVDNKLDIDQKKLIQYLKKETFPEDREYGIKPINKWSVDEFKSFIEDRMNAQNKIADKKLAEILDLKDVDVIEYLNNQGSGLNNNKQFNKYQNWRAALYDIWNAIKL